MRFRTLAVVFLSSAALAGAALGILSALHSNLFLVQVVEVAELAEGAPLDAQTITELAAVPVGRENLFDLSLASVESRILRNEWIREVQLTKRFPQTLSISVVFREPRALTQLENGALSYVDQDGHVFGRMSLRRRPDLPLFSGMAGNPEPLAGALALLARWERSDLGRYSQVASMSWDPERGYRAVVTYAIQAEAGRRWARTLVDLGQEFDTDMDLHLSRLSQVFRYLSQRAIPARQIFADAGKKIVVKTAHGS
jgi:cell division protein FtsQ